MQVSNVNSMNFKGLWEVKSKPVVKYDGGTVNEVDLVYHTDVDETPEQTKKALAQEPEGTIFEYGAANEYIPDRIDIVKSVKVGTPLPETVREYRKCQETMVKSVHKKAYAQRDSWSKSVFDTKDQVVDFLKRWMCNPEEIK